MGLATIRKQYDKAMGVATREAHAQCKQAAIEMLVKIQPSFPITKIICGHGSWAIKMDPISITYDDGSTDEKADIEDTIIEWLDGRKIWNPTNFRQAHVTTLLHLRDLLDWWVDISGGTDITPNRK